MQYITGFFVTLLCLLSLHLDAQADNDDRAAVRSAIENYVDVLYQADSSLVEQGVHELLQKRGFYRPSDTETYSDMNPMTYEQLRRLAGRWNKSGWLPEDAVKEIVIFEVQDKTASGKLTAHWGTDYFHLAKFEEGWKIVNVLWQSLPKQAGTASNR